MVNAEFKGSELKGTTGSLDKVKNMLQDYNFKMFSLMKRVLKE